MPQKRSTFIPENSNHLQEKFINYIMKDGKKSIARTIFQDTLQILQEKSKGNPVKTFEKAVENVKPRLEVKAQRVGGAVYQVPREVKPNRQIILSFRWILSAAREKKSAAMAHRLAQELLDASNNTGTAIKKKEDTHRMAEANKAFAHFAKYKK